MPVDEPQQEDLRKVHVEMNALRQAIDKLTFNRAGQLQIKETYGQSERGHLTGTTAEPNKDNGGLFEFNEPVETVTFFNVSSVACFVEIETFSIDTAAATTTSIPLAGAVGAFVTVPVKCKRVAVRTAAGTAHVVVRGLRW